MGRKSGRRHYRVAEREVKHASTACKKKACKFLIKKHIVVVALVTLLVFIKGFVFGYMFGKKA